jgi:hypothetical protein
MNDAVLWAIGIVYIGGIAWLVRTRQLTNRRFIGVSLAFIALLASVGALVIADSPLEGVGYFLVMLVPTLVLVFALARLIEISTE